MSINWSKRDLVNRLATQVVLARDLKVGDYIVDDFGGFMIARVKRTKRRTIEIYDEDDNGGGGYGLNAEIRIIVREAFV